MVGGGEGELTENEHGDCRQLDDAGDKLELGVAVSQYLDVIWICQLSAHASLMQNKNIPVLLITKFKGQIIAVERRRRIGDDGQIDGTFDALHFADDAADLQFHAGTPAHHHVLRFVLNVIWLD